MRIILLCSNQSNQHALASKISKEFDLVGISIENKKSTPSKSVFYFFSKIIDRLLFFMIIKSWKSMLNFYKEGYSLPTTKTIYIENINSKEVIDFINELKPDLIMVSGTRLIKQGILELKIPKGIINLHTGLSPYVKGGPNCTNWCIANNKIHLIGNTIMWIDKGIDSGNIITTDLIDFNGNENLTEIHIKVMEHAHNLYIKTLRQIKNNYSNCPSVKQSTISKGELFLNKDWNFKTKLKFHLNVLRNVFKKSISSDNYKKVREELVCVKLPE